MLAENSITPDCYTYTLRRPNGKVFYAGRGQGYSWDRHEQKAKRGERCRVTSIIQEIWNQGQQVQKRKEHEHLTEEEAYARQVELYAKYSAENPEMIYLGSYPRPIGHGKNIGASRQAKGYSHSQQARDKMVESRTGKTYSEERLARNAERLKKNADRLNTVQANAKSGKTRRGREMPPHVRVALAVSNKKRMDQMSEEEKAIYLHNWIEAGQKASRRVVENSSIELKYEETLKASGVEYIKQLQVSIYRCDFYIPSTNTVIEINGCWIHRCKQCGHINHNAEEIWARDARKMACLQSKGYNVQVIWEHSFEGYRLR